MTPIVFYLFLALNINAVGSVDGGQAVRAKTLADCQRLVTSYNVTERELNDGVPLSVQQRWNAQCIIMTVAAKRPKGDV